MRREVGEGRERGEGEKGKREERIAEGERKDRRGREGEREKIKWGKI
jgi:hypothetical protein